MLIICLFPTTGNTQPEIMPWGNIRSFHLNGEKLNFETSVRSVYSDWSGCIASERCNWEGTQTYHVSGKTTTMSHFLQALPLNYAVTFLETGADSVSEEVSIEATDDIDQAGAYFCFEIPGSEFVGGTLEIGTESSIGAIFNLDTSIPDGQKEYGRVKGDRILVRTGMKEYEVISDQMTEIFVRQDFIDRPGYLNDPLPAKPFVASDPGQPVANYQVYFTLIDGNAHKGDQRTANFSIKVNGSVNREDVRIAIDPAHPGRPFAGVGSNYRVSDLSEDSEVISYCMDRIRVAWGRVAFDWRQWQPEENGDPSVKARAGELSKSFYDQIEMARMLAKRHIPTIVTIWAPPSWAVDASRVNRQGLEHDTKISLDPHKIEAIGKSIADYLEYLKTDYGLEFPLFSFNEIDYGVMVFQTPEEHAFYTKALGRSFAERGLVTKMLLGDTGACTVRSNRIIIPAVEDSSTHEYIGAVACHTWHGCTPKDLEAWSLSASKLNVPFLITEGGPNSAQHRYPQHFLDMWFQLSEIDLYLRVCRYGQPATIMAWQLTPDYSVLVGNGLYGDNGPLRPTQRFWNLKQLGSTPEGSFSIPVEVGGPNITAAAFADILNGWYTIHMVNNSAKRKAIIEGIPAGVKTLDVYQTDDTRGMKKARSVTVKNGVAEVVLDSACYTTVTNAPVSCD